MAPAKNGMGGISGRGGWAAEWGEEGGRNSGRLWSRRWQSMGSRLRVTYVRTVFALEVWQRVRSVSMPLGTRVEGEEYIWRCASEACLSDRLIFLGLARFRHGLGPVVFFYGGEFFYGDL